MEAIAVRARLLEAGYGERKVLDNLSLDLQTGRTATLLGPGGAGKSTLLRLIHGVCPPDFWHRGQVSRGPRPSRLLSQKPAAPAGTLRESLRALDPAAGPDAVWAGVPGAVQAVRGLLDLPLGSLGREETRLALLTLTLAGDPPLVLLDEPEANLDEPWHGWVRSLVAAWRGRATILLATHHLGLARESSDFVALLVGGRIVEAGPVEDFFERPVHPRTRDYLRYGS